jgi:hypothetical protein
MNEMNQLREQNEILLAAIRKIAAGDSSSTGCAGDASDIAADALKKIEKIA